MAQVGIVAVRKALDFLRGEAGLSLGVAALAVAEDIKLPVLTAQQILGQNVAFDVAEKTAGAKYPAYYVYCERLTNSLREKFRQFSGTAEMAIDIRVSQDRLEGLEHKMQIYVDAATEALDAHRGDWGDGMFYAGSYKVQFGPVKHGGKNFMQTAKVSYEVDISV
jgi:hypothetical protein